MLKKLQIKLLSNAGELLNLVTCLAGQVSVFRGASPSEIRPYQRALTGSAGRERFSISLDGADFMSDQHTLIGFGEPPPYHGMSVREFLHHSGYLEGSIEGLLISYGLAHVGDIMCANLSQDEERRIRLIAATNAPDKILIVSEPFEPIATAWRDRFAELLLSFARSRKGMVVVTSLSYRPECWIDNESIARIEVGQTAQRTIGFQAQDPSNANLVKQLREMLGDDDKVRELLGQGSPGFPSDTEKTIPTRTLTTAALGTASILSQHRDAATPTTSATSASTSSTALTLTILGGLGVGIVALGALYITRSTTPLVQTASIAPPALQSAVPVQTTSMNHPSEPPTQPLDMNSNVNNSQTAITNAHVDTEAAAVISEPEIQQPIQPKLLLDEYPEVVRESLLMTTRGILSPSQDNPDASIPAPVPVPSQNTTTGNLFTLLQGASSKETEGSAGATESSEPYEAPPEPDQEQFQSAEERREAIRQKFLEAIRSAAERREHPVEE